MFRVFAPTRLTALVLSAAALPAHAGELVMVGGIPVDFVLFALTLLGVALFHRHTLCVGLTGMGAITLYKLLFTGFRAGDGLAGLAAHFGHEWVVLANLFCLLMGFALLSRHFEKSHVPAILPQYLPNDWKGGFLLLVAVFALSSFLDNIAAALIGGALAHQLFKGKVHVGFLAAIVAASNAGGSGSVVGDTSTMMMWIDGIRPGDVARAYVAAIVALVVTAYFASKQQHAHQPIVNNPDAAARVDMARVGIVGLILVFAVSANFIINVKFTAYAGYFPFIGVAVWLAILLSLPVRRPDWEVLPESLKGSIFLLSLVACASMMPVEKLPPASALAALSLGFVSAVFDNVPLTALALKQGGYDWGVLAYAVGFGGSMVWFGSSSGVALSSIFPEARSVTTWVRQGWHVALAYLAGFAVLSLVLGWNPQAAHKQASSARIESQVPAGGPVIPAP